MTLGYLGIAAVLLIGIAVVAYGWLADRSDTKRREQMLVTPPERRVPGLGESAPTPSYFTQDELLHGPGSKRTLAAPLDVSEIELLLAGAPSVPVGHAGREFANTGEYCVLDHPQIVVSDNALTNTRELLPILAVAGDGGLVLVAPDLAASMLDSVRVNVAQGKLAATVLLVPDAVQRAQLASMVGATPLPLADLRAGYLPSDALGTCQVWVSTAERSWVIGAG